MTCEIFAMPGGGRAIICSRHRERRCACGRAATLLCDWKKPRKDGTCDRPICVTCATSPAPGKDLCPAHAEALARWNASILPGVADMNEQLFGQGDAPIVGGPR